MGLVAEVVTALCVAGAVKVTLDAVLALKRGFSTLGCVAEQSSDNFINLHVEQRLSREASTMDASFPYLCARDRVVLSTTGMDGSLRGQILE